MSPTDDDYLLLEEVCAIARSAPGTARHWIRTGRLPSIRPGRRRLVRRSDLERFLAEANPTAKTRPP